MAEDSKAGIEFLRNHADRERREGREMNAVRIEGAADALAEQAETIQRLRAALEEILAKAEGYALSVAREALRGAHETTAEQK